ncbi:MAG: peptide chain release factor 2 [Thermodesulfobacteriota bacterium]|nr:peptide chain release factor 2 [Thermodesulfobacteriota bacterium]
MSLELKHNISLLYQKTQKLQEYLDLVVKRDRLRELESFMARADFWDDPESATDLLKERTTLLGHIERWDTLHSEVEDAELLLEMAHEEEDRDAERDVENQVSALEKEIRQFSLDIMMDGEDDAKNAIVSINAGAGGTDSQDWVEILFRMYTRWMEKKGYKYQVVDLQPGDEAGIKGVTFTVTGVNCYGFMKVETGVHRLVRISPFNSNGKRHTSFASVFVTPELKDDIKINIDEGDLRVDVYRASGAGGQHVNKTSSAVRITHFPSGIVTQCQQESSQHRNKEIAMKVLKSRLYQLEKEKQNQKMQDLHDNKDDIAWGSQIRSYVLHPYQMVKDHRTDQEAGDINSVLDGDLDLFIEGVLLSGKIK